MKCPECGSEMKQNEKICANCGKGEEDKVEILSPLPQSENKQTTIEMNENNEQQHSKTNNKALIIIMIILGILAIGTIILAVVVRITFNRTNKEENKKEPQTTDTPTKTTTDRTVVKTVEDPTGHTITIVTDEIYGYVVKEDHLIEKAQEMRKNAKVLNQNEIDKLMATTEQKEAIMIIINSVNNPKELFATKAEIIKKLKEEKYSDEVIKYAMDNCGVDWQEQAEIKAQLILASGGYSKKELIDLMLYEQYTESEINTALSHLNVNFYEQAVYKACFLRFTTVKYGNSFTRGAAKEFMENNKYTKEEIAFALKVIYDEMD